MYKEIVNVFRSDNGARDFFKRRRGKVYISEKEKGESSYLKTFYRWNGIMSEICVKTMKWEIKICKIDKYWK